MKKDSMPYSLEIEECVLGSILIDNEKLTNLDYTLTTDDFYSSHIKILFNAVETLINDSQIADIITVSESLNNSQLGDCGGLAYLAELVKRTPSSLNFQHYVEILLNYKTAREMMNISNNIQHKIDKNIYSDVESSDKIVEETEAELFKLMNDSKSEMKSLTNILENILNYLDSDETKYIPTGLIDLDKKIGGLEPDEITIIAGRPAMGKTACLISIIVNHIYSLIENKEEKSPQSPIFMFSLEMSADVLIMRIISILSGIPFTDIKNKNLDESDYGKLSNSIGTLLKFKNQIIIDDDGYLTPDIFRRKLRHYIRKYGQPSLVGIDYVQLMSLKKQSENRATEIATISRKLKIYTKEFNVPLVVLSQLNRSVESRPDKRPNLADLKESGALEQDATTVIFLYRDEVYNENTENRGIAELIIAKSRNGPTGTVRAQFNGPCMNYRNLAK